MADLSFQNPSMRARLFGDVLCLCQQLPRVSDTDWSSYLVWLDTLPEVHAEITLPLPNGQMSRAQRESLQAFHHMHSTRVVVLTSSRVLRASVALARLLGVNATALPRDALPKAVAVIGRPQQLAQVEHFFRDRGSHTPEAPLV